MMKQYSRLLVALPLVTGLLIMLVSNVKADDLASLYTETVQQHGWLSQEQKEYLLEAGAHESFVSHLQGVTRSNPTTDSAVYIRAFLDFYRNYSFQNRAPHILIQDFQEHWSLQAQIIITEEEISKQQTLLYEQEAAHHNDWVAHQLRLQLDQSNQQLQDLIARLAQSQQQLEEHKRKEASKYEGRKQRAIEREQKIEQLQNQVGELERVKKSLLKEKNKKKRISSEQERLRKEVLETSSQATLQVHNLQRENQRLRQVMETPTGSQAPSEPAACEQICLSDSGAPLQKYATDQSGKKESNQKKTRKDKFSAAKRTGGNQSAGNRVNSGQKSSAQVSQSAKPDASKPEAVHDNPKVAAHDNPEVAAPGNSNYERSIQWVNRLTAFSPGYMTRLLLKASSAAFAVFAVRHYLESRLGPDAHTYSTTENQTELQNSGAPVKVPDDRATAEPESVQPENAHLPLNEPEPASPGKAEENQPAQHPCYLTTDYELIELCLQLPPEKQARMLLVWDLRHDLLVTRYTLYQRQINDKRLNRIPIDSVLYSKAKGDHFYLLPERFITLSNLEKREQYEFYRLIVNTSDSPKAPLSQRLNEIALFGVFCGSMPSDLQRHCFAAMDKEILKNGYEGLNAPFPDKETNPGGAEFSGKAALMVSWPLIVNGETISLANRAKTLAVLIGEKGALKLLLMKGQQIGLSAGLVKANMLEDGEYQIFSQSMVKDRPEWVGRSDPFVAIAGVHFEPPTEMDDVLLFYCSNRSTSHFTAIKDGKLVPVAWSIHGLRAYYNQLLLAFMDHSLNQQQQILETLNSWSKSCQSSNNCPINIVQSYYNGKPQVSGQVARRLNNLSEDDPLWHVSGLKFSQLKQIKKPLLNQWLRLLSQAIEATFGKNPEKTQIRKIADMARLLCGISNGTGSRELMISCFQQLIEKELKQPDWKNTRFVSDFFAGFSSVKADRKPRITLVALRARLGLFLLTEPRFLPSLSYQGRQRFVSHKKGGRISRYLNLPPDYYLVYTLNNNLTMTPSPLDLMGPKKLINFVIGSHLFLGSRSDINDQFYMIEPENPYIPTPHPAYPHNGTLYSKENFQFKVEEFIETLHNTPCADPGITGINQQLCDFLVDYAEVEILHDLLKISKSLPKSRLKFPESFPLHGELTTPSLERRVYYRSAGRLKCTKKSELLNSKKYFHLIYDQYQSLNLMDKRHALVIKSYHSLINQAGIARPVRWKALYHIISNCGFSCEQEQRECARHILSILQSDDDAWRSMDRVLKQPGGISRFSYPATAPKKTSAAKLTRVSVFDRQYKLVRQITLPVMRINGNEGFFPGYFKDPENRWVHEVILRGLTPGTAYKVELFSPTLSDWVTQDELAFTAIADETTHSLNISVDKLYRVTSNSEQVSYIFFPVQKIRDFDQLTDRYSIWKKLPAMPKLSWEQPVHFKKGQYSF